ncbi:uncharacterized protein BN666_00512 [Bacteroides sp. CAG:462]|nr:uncharacterized protein BN666_00512 [Bacteroides sp. CAG:462]
MECQGTELTHGMHLTGCNDKVLGSLVLENQPHALHIVLGIAPVAACVEVAQIEFVLMSLGDAGCRQGNLTCDEVLAATFTLVVEQDAIHAIHAIALAVVLRYPETILLGHSIGRTRIERSRLALGNFLHLAEKLGSGCLIDAAGFLQSADAHRLQQTQRPECICLCRIFRYVKADFHMALCSQVIDFIGLHLRNDADERTGVRHVAPMQVHESAFLHVAHPLVQVQMLDASGVKR